MNWKTPLLALGTSFLFACNVQPELGTGKDSGSDSGASLSQADTAGWIQITGAAHDLAAGPINNGTDDALYAIGIQKVVGFPDDYQIWNWLFNDPESQHWSLFPTGGAAIRVASHPSGSAWTVNNEGEIHEWVQDKWEQREDAIAKEIAIGPAGTIYIISDVQYPGHPGNYYIMKKTGSDWMAWSDWTTLPGAARQIAVGPDEQPWVVNSYGAIYKYDGSTWALVNDAPHAIDIDVGANGDVFIIGEPYDGDGPGTVGTVYKMEGSSWTALEGRKGTRVAVNKDGIPYICQEPYGLISRYRF